MQNLRPHLAHHRNSPGTRQEWRRWVDRPFAAAGLLTSRLGRSIRGRLVRSAARSLLPELAAIFGFLALLWIGISIASNHEYYAAEAGAVQTTGNLARAFEESTRDIITQIDQMLLSARAFRAALGERFDLNAWARTQTLPNKMTAAIGMADSTGLVFADTLPVPPGVTIVDRPHFRAQLDPTRDDLFISRPVLGRVSGVSTIQFTRKLLGPHGEFAGVVVLSLDCAELSRFYQTLDLGAGFVSLLSSDGTILARGPMTPGSIGLSLADNAGFRNVLHHPDGEMRNRGPVSGLELITSFRHLRDFPLIVMVGLDTDTVFKPYQSLRNRLVMSGAAITLAIGLIGTLWLQQKRRSVESRRALTITLETISQGILMVDARGRVPVVNPRALDLLELSDETPEAARGHAASRAIALAAGDAANPTHMLPTRMLGAPVLATSMAPARIRATNAGKAAGEPSQDSQFETVRRDGTIIEVHSHTLADGGFVQTYTDVTSQRLADAQVRYLAHFDQMTGLPNRVQLRQYIGTLLDDRAAGAPRLIALLIVDLDGFKDVNDALGHDVGDELLVVVARRLQALVRDGDFVGRLGGDEFVIVASGLDQADDVAPLARRVLQQLAEPVQVGDHQVRNRGKHWHCVPSDGWRELRYAAQACGYRTIYRQGQRARHVLRLRRADGRRR